MLDKYNMKYYRSEDIRRFMLALDDLNKNICVSTLFMQILLINLKALELSEEIFDIVFIFVDITFRKS